MKWPDTIYGRLRLTYVALATLPLLIVGLILTWATYDSQLTQALNLQEELAQRVGTQAVSTLLGFKEILVTAERVAQLGTFTPDQEDEIKAILDNIISKQSAFLDVSLMFANGEKIVFASRTDREPADENYINSEEFKYFLNNPSAEFFFGPVTYTLNTHRPLMDIAIPLRDLETKELKSVLSGSVQLEEISHLIENLEFEEGQVEDESVYIVYSGVIIAHPESHYWLQETKFTPPVTKDLAKGLAGNRVLMVTDDWSLGDQIFTVVTESSPETVFNLALKSWLIILALIVFTSSAAALLALYATRNITRPINALVAVAGGIREGDLSQQAPPAGLAELDTLANTFNSMTAQLRQMLEALEQRVAERTQALRTSAEVSHYLSTILDEEKLVHEVAGLVQSSFDYYHVNIFLFDETLENLVLVAGTGEAGRTMLADHYQFPAQQGPVGQVATTNRAILIPDTLLNPDWKPNPLLPNTRSILAVPIARGAQVLGVLEIQHNVATGLKQETTDLIQSIANQLAVALINAQSFEQLVAEKLMGVQQKEEVERRLDTYRRSPVGQAEIFARDLLNKPEQSLNALHQLAQNAGQSLDTAALLSHLPRLLEDTRPNGGTRNLQNIGIVAKLAEGVNFLFTSQNAPELLVLGLRILTKQLEQPIVDGWDNVSQARMVYQVCLSAVEANTVSQLTQLDWTTLTEVDFPSHFPLTQLVQVLTEFESVVESLIAYERVTTLQDKLAYLVSAVEKLRHVERQARSLLGSADISIVLRISENWLAIVTRALSELQTQAKISCRLLTRHSWQNDVISLTLNVRNDGRGAAINLRINLLPGQEFTVLDEAAELKQLNPGEEEQITLRVRPRMEGPITQFRTRFVIFYDDPRGPNQSEHYADILQLLTEQKQFQYIPNPYIVGTPLEAGSALFFGREELLGTIQNNLMAAHRNNLVLIGQRRMGKTSLLKQLRVRMDDSHIPVYLDGQVMGLDPGMANFFLSLATEITFALEDQGIHLDQPTLDDFGNSPASNFEHQFLAKVRSVIDGRPLLILFDEFEELESAVQRGYLEASIFSYLRHLMQHTPNLSFIFCGTHRLEELVTDYWNVLFNISLYQRVGNLSQEEAMHLVQQPVESFGMRYDDLALDKIWRVTSGHPYFLQLICHSLVNRHNKTQRNYISIADVNASLDEILSTGEAHFIYLWTESNLDERITMVAMSRMIPLTGSVKAVQIADYLLERGVQIERRAIREALYHLMLRDILREDDLEVGDESVYHWQLGLLGLWVEKSKSLNRIMDEGTT